MDGLKVFGVALSKSTVAPPFLREISSSLEHFCQAGGLCLGECSAADAQNASAEVSLTAAEGRADIG